MREGMGKYRGISIDSGKWLYGCLLHDAMKEKASYYILSDDVMNFDEYEAVKDGSVGQFTGLRDKNGVEIYEGDFIRGDSTTYTVDCGKDMLDFKISGCQDGWRIRLRLSFASQAESLKVTGNIHKEATK